MERGPHRIALVFVDGLGLAPAGEENPLATVPMPALGRLLGGPLTSQRVGAGEDWVLAGLDATLGIPGLPQSATGQTTLLTGVDAAGRLGRHVPALPGAKLKALIEEHGLLRRLAAAGHRVTFANPLSEAFLEEIRGGRRRPSAMTWAAITAGIPLRLLADLERGAAVAWDVTGEGLAARTGLPLATVAPEEAGRRLASLAADHDLTLWETFLTDLAGHRRWGITAEVALGRLDGLLAGLLAARPTEVTVVLTSDHGNVEEAGHRRHTRNPVPLLAVGPAAGELAGLARLDEVAPALARLVGR